MTQDDNPLPFTPLIESEALARLAGVRRVLVKDERARPFGNFKILGGMRAGLAAIARVTGSPTDTLHDQIGVGHRLICASDGNHGLAVAAAAAAVGATAAIFLHEGVPPERARRIEALGAQIVWIIGTYDDAVDAAAAAAQRGDGLLIPDTSADPDDPVVADVMAGYAIMTDELAEQFVSVDAVPSHIFVQAGVGGLAAAVADGLRARLPHPACHIVVEPENAACVGRALAAGAISRLDGDLHTAAEMLSCGEASSSALRVLQRHRVEPVAVSERLLIRAAALAADVGIETTPSGAAGLAGLIQATEDGELRAQVGLDAASIALLIVTEGKPRTDPEQPSLPVLGRALLSRSARQP